MSNRSWRTQTRSQCSTLSVWSYSTQSRTLQPERDLKFICYVLFGYFSQAICCSLLVAYGMYVAPRYGDSMWLHKPNVQSYHRATSHREGIGGGRGQFRETLLHRSFYVITMVQIIWPAAGCWWYCFFSSKWRRWQRWPQRRLRWSSFGQRRRPHWGLSLPPERFSNVCPLNAATKEAKASLLMMLKIFCTCSGVALLCDLRLRLRLWFLVDRSSVVWSVIGQDDFAVYFVGWCEQLCACCASLSVCWCGSPRRVVSEWSVLDDKIPLVMNRP